ncbi:metal-dependent hydrolase (plasmid) [Haloferax mediterranei ATCC 33500]|uniref:Metal-dependent hydrolase n=1 Tax=Haloferax mediterranei (strain ATCC 33500 / DSM 1411 / JCM 8866 / NBRC 14739 / NCIMB 2177 / R-4) TaxID=523841 RepID=I3RAT9_HALMT|nr:metal-dependent hydrolase [Haloferax mediterranei]AFK21349.1 putative membrane-bound metal-dependent hydrolase [Haloferax mediterranei ATCC 33500]AHZ24568.1 metal-dependent hydrolase [Haloferax mediterranei ATCC 33500]ELZ97324.1 putative membrane-bound metal-dependent hydrolase [Haloferax mediterranei ATCC 33500]MDX5990379.1 metal-dependent hydrolase [Haloferax mediterranei ATCC 33500]QCQ76961.1 metal-dependent hydrolase [Haloferax mediterranei ATCC 33500]
MFPWEHAAVGYNLISLWARVTNRRLDGWAVLAALFGTQFPDLVDKPLAWSLHVLPSGISLAHSILVSVPVSVVVVLVARRYKMTTVGVAFALGYLSHIPGDLLYSGFFFGNYEVIQAFLWPFSHGGESTAGGLLGQTWFYVSRFGVYLYQTGAWEFVLLEVALLGSAVWLWLSDGTPGLGLMKRSITGIRQSITK